jgi:hypothetical protein
MIRASEEFCMKKFVCLSVFVLGAALFFGCAGGPKAGNRAEVPSYYVRANGGDLNDGLSEKAPFKTLGRAVDAAKRGDD